MATPDMWNTLLIRIHDYTDAAIEDADSRAYTPEDYAAKGVRLMLARAEMLAHIEKIKRCVMTPAELDIVEEGEREYRYVCEGCNWHGSEPSWHDAGATHEAICPLCFGRL